MFFNWMLHFFTFFNKRNCACTVEPCYYGRCWDVQPEDVKQVYFREMYGSGPRNLPVKMRCLYEEGVCKWLGSGFSGPSCTKGG